MLDNIKNVINLKTIDKHISEQNYDIALEKLNDLINEGYKPAETFLKRGLLCQKLLMLEDAYSDFTYIIRHCANKNEGYKARLFLNLEIQNYIEAITDANKLLEIEPDNEEYIYAKLKAFIFSDKLDDAKELVCEHFDYNKYEILLFLLKQTAHTIAKDELLKALKILELIDLIDKDNPLKLFNEANIYNLAGQKDKANEIEKQLNNVFPKYFVSHFKFTDMYSEKDSLELDFLLELAVFDKQKIFAYPLKIIEGYKLYSEGHILDSKECFEKAIKINPNKPEAYILLAQTYQLMSGYDNPEYIEVAKENYITATKIYEQQGLRHKAEELNIQLKHLSSNLVY